MCRINILNIHLNINFLIKPFSICLKKKLSTVAGDLYLGIIKIKFVLTLSCCSFTAEFTQGMILPTANGVAKPQSTSQSKASQDKTQVCADKKHLQPSAALYIFKQDSYP